MAMLFRRRVETDPVSAGARFRRARRDSVETARVLAIIPDPAGIPHVRFQLHIERGSIAVDEQRTLALTLFRDLYREPVPA